MSVRKTAQGSSGLADASRDLTGLVRQVKAILPQFSDDVVCQVLAEEDENVERAIENLLTRPEPPKKAGKKKERGANAASQQDAAASSEVPLPISGKVANGSVRPPSAMISAKPVAPAPNGAKGKQASQPAVQKSALDQALEDRPKTPAEKEVQKFKKKIREIEAIEERVNSGEKVDPLQLEKASHKKQIQSDLHSAERKAEKEVAELVAQIKKEAADKARKEAAAPAPAHVPPQRQPAAAAAPPAQVEGPRNGSSLNHRVEEEWHPHIPAPEPQGAPTSSHASWQQVDQAASSPQEPLLRLQQEQLQREQLERELLAVQQMHKEQLRREQAQREELQRQLEMERAQRMGSEPQQPPQQAVPMDRLGGAPVRPLHADLPQPPGVQPEDLQQNRRAERPQPQGGPMTPPTAPPTTAPTAPAAQASQGEPRSAGAGQELLSLLHSSSIPSPDSASYEQSANLAKQLGGGVAVAPRARDGNEKGKGKGVWNTSNSNNNRPRHQPPTAPPNSQQQNQPGSKGAAPQSQRTATGPPQQPPQTQPRKRENAWHRWPPASLEADGNGPPLLSHPPGVSGNSTVPGGKEEDDREFMNEYSTPLNESQFTKEQREEAERIAREIERTSNAQQGNSNRASWSDNPGHGGAGSGLSTEGGGRDWRGGSKGGHAWGDSKGSWDKGRRGGGKGGDRGGKGYKKGGGGGKASTTN
mmetsp:Transcript_62641/g.149414  ORF Transcript_62641/g.149414 Transcript_62641/m.149414 type:complete len:701 (-) Transcript_62641:80-2182(-)|eukprot:CAMPEP_0178426360 /NCGR_PEP_ID=MMETSP0689_2-20121128/29195_1 /TAXON_ID=160604 /ORGANISM="Amphidinium massartii, Strain CS-259" /LENGTH=700 /DNA_ID=CAMNT_0020048045 /DNA_START=70 /DNA_END=2172 /DNA_ORIENTATION=-